MIPPEIHAKLDAASAAGLALLPPLLTQTRPHVRRRLIAAGAFVAGYSLLTRYRPDQERPIGMDTHRLIDLAQGAAFCAAATKVADTRLRRGMLGYGLFSIAAAALTHSDAHRVGHQVPVPRSAITGHKAGRLREVARDVALLPLGIVNVVLLGRRDAGDRGWVLLDAGLQGTAGRIAKAAAERFGPDARPAAIVMTHGHFDHVGALEELAEHWDAPVFAHPSELPFLNGSRSYPPPDPAVGGMMARLSPLYPRSPLDLGPRLRLLPDDGSVPFAESWRWIHTPGHTPGHVSLWRADDGVLLSGDAVITTRQESAYDAAVQPPELHGPPSYFTPDWIAAADSVRRLAALHPRTLVAHHGQPLQGPEMRAALETLARDFERVAMPQDLAAGS